MKELEEKLYQQGYKLIAGIDEAGRGPLAGPVCAAAVILPQDAVIEGINDSKKLSAKKREKLFDEIIQAAVAYSIQFTEANVIDEINIKNATQLAMHRAAESLKPAPDFIMVDGNDRVPYTTPFAYIIKGDAKSQTIAAASILAKVSRDRLMISLAEKYPQYHFEKHKGYGTREHMEAIRRYGTCELHRQSFMTDKVLGL